MAGNVIVETKERVKRIEIGRADKQNALMRQMYAATSEALRAADADTAACAVLIRGKPDCFTAGE